MMDQDRCWIFGDESGLIDKDRFFAVGIIGTKKPRDVISALKLIRQRTGYFDEVSYKSGNEKRILCSIRWVDWFLGHQDMAHFKILIKDAREFDVSYFRRNLYQTGAPQLAYCESYREVMCNFADYASAPKGFVYSQIGLAHMHLASYLATRVPGLTRKYCYTKGPKEKKINGSEYTGAAELLQLCDLLTSSTRGLCCSLFGDSVSETWDKNTLRKNIHYHVPDIKEKLGANQNIYFPQYSPFVKQKFVIYKWRGGTKSQGTPIS